jgi:hypothetical protein
LSATEKKPLVAKKTLSKAIKTGSTLEKMLFIAKTLVSTTQKIFSDTKTSKTAKKHLLEVFAVLEVQIPAGWLHSMSPWAGSQTGAIKSAGQQLLLCARASSPHAGQSPAYLG